MPQKHMFVRKTVSYADNGSILTHGNDKTELCVKLNEYLIEDNFIYFLLNSRGKNKDIRMVDRTPHFLSRTITRKELSIHKHQVDTQDQP